MNIIVAGPRDYIDKKKIYNGISLVLQRLNDIYGINQFKIIEGGATGVDFIAQKYAIEHNIPFQTYNANWKEFGKAAGPIRNEEMAKSADVLIAFHSIVSPTKGTSNMIKTAKKHNLKIYTINIDV